MERDGYRSELAAAHARIAELEQEVRELSGKLDAVTAPSGEAAQTASFDREGELGELLDRKRAVEQSISVWKAAVWGGEIAFLMLASGLAVEFNLLAAVLIPVVMIVLGERGARKLRKLRQAQGALRVRIDELSAQTKIRVAAEGATASPLLAEADEITAVSEAGVRTRAR